ncbi:MULTISPECIES: type I methionyl aminopeptidase [unclassified Rhodococcus (in: high G+C Gram-positive bacteria)]|uniref:type I methionyl aminopeptidase n=1 Tax=unclassified Rhodococcus (in: high G+C Gram-positive bacteria) TaxID=192944 RepID=UPI0009293117|nr:type I methionyl aminopeptidase [Rhodococcus sp. M8]OLL20133.1 type I methionyl aminopeptidase [Rhodococcus sp. M8]QPG43977.1 type I methionyl aminopeptidase [Rhodococcus sp. M8]
MVELKTSGEIEAMRAAGAVVADALAAVRAHAAIGVSLKELDDVAAAVVRDAGATSPFLGYHPEWAPSPFPGVVCASVDDGVVHGIPGGYRLRDGDLVSIDCGAVLDGWCGDAAVSFTVGAADREALARGIAAAVPGNRLGDIGAAIGGYVRSRGYGMLADHGGHGIGRRMHEDPHVPNEGRAGRGMRLRPGLVLAIEPMLHAGGGDAYRHDPDGWTLRTADGSRAAHCEHTVAITEDGPVVLTQR